MSYNKTTMITKKKVLVLDDTDSDEEESGKYDLVARVKDKIKELIVQHKRNYTPSLEAIEKISKAFRIAPFELLCDREEIFTATPENKAFIEKFRVLNEKQKEAIFQLLDCFNN